MISVVSSIVASIWYDPVHGGEIDTDLIFKYDILPLSITERLQFATSAMHAYGHQWSCQLVYNPRLRKGLGLTDGEGTERLWSRLRGLIGIERTSAVCFRST
jgi:hypothetical protein